MRFFLMTLGIVLLSSVVTSTMAQEDSPPLQNLSKEDVAQLRDLEAQVLLEVPTLNALTYWTFNMASEDGNYLAQNAAELQTYKDLDLGYQYIQDTYLRRQLQLPEEQGIIIVSAEESGEGYKNGFRAGDIVLQVDDESVDTQYDLVIALTKNRGTQRSAKVRRDGEIQDLIVVLSESDVKVPTRWIIGVFVDEISDVTKAQLGLEGGAAITQLTDDGPARKKGMVEHDIITHINGKLINNLDELKEVVASSGGQKLSVDFMRLGKQIKLEVDPQEVPDESSNTALSRVYATYAQNLLIDNVRESWTPTDMAQGEYKLGLVPVNVEAETTSDRLDRLEASIKRIEEVLKDQLEDSDGQN